MRMIDCPVCGAKRGAKRYVGIGTILGIALTWVVLNILLSILCFPFTAAFGIGFIPFQILIATLVLIFSWVVVIVFYPVRCIVCGAKEAKDKEMEKENTKCFVLLLGFLVLMVVMVCLKGNI